MTAISVQSRLGALIPVCMLHTCVLEAGWSLTIDLWIVACGPVLQNDHLRAEIASADVGAVLLLTRLRGGDDPSGLELLQGAGYHCRVAEASAALLGVSVQSDIRVQEEDGSRCSSS